MQVDPVCYTVVSVTPLNYLCNHTKSSCILFGCKGDHFFYLGSPTNILWLYLKDTSNIIYKKVKEIPENHGIKEHPIEANNDSIFIIYFVFV